MIDENLSRYATWTYDPLGRANSSEHAGAVEHVQIGYFDNASVVTDALGTNRVRYLTQVQGVTRGTGETQPAGAGCAASVSGQTFDSNGNLASRDDFDGNRTCLASDMARNLTIQTVEGLASSTTCTAVLATGATLPSGSRKIQTQWHPDWPLPARRAEPLRLTTWVYNGQPDPFNGGTLAACAPATAAALLPDGKPIAVLCKQVQQATTDANGSLGFGAALLGTTPPRQETWTYNENGQMLTHKGARIDMDDTSTATYYTVNGSYSIGDLATLANSAGQVTTFTDYSLHGQPLRSVGPSGVISLHTYDLRQRPTGESTGGLQTTWQYDPAGLLTLVTLPDGGHMSYTYDPAHRLRQITDSAGNSMTYTLDNASNRIREDLKDPGGTLQRTITRSIDALGRVNGVTGARQ